MAKRLVHHHIRKKIIFKINTIVILSIRQYNYSILYLNKTIFLVYDSTNKKFKNSIN